MYNYEYVYKGFLDGTRNLKWKSFDEFMLQYSYEEGRHVAAYCKDRYHVIHRSETFFRDAWNDYANFCKNTNYKI